MILAQWDITKRCNLHCKHCRVEFRSTTNELSLSAGKALLDQLYQLGIELLVVSGGEPLLRRDILDLIEYAQKFQVLTITSNGTLIDSNMAHELSRFTNLRISLSLDGIGDTHDHFRGMHGTFEKVMNALKLLTKYEVKKSIRCTLSQLNFKDAFQLVEVAARHSVSFLEIRSVIPKLAK